MTNRRIKIICPICGSEDINKDASARWSIEDQCWKLGGEQDCETCGNCGYETDGRMPRMVIPEIVTPWTEADSTRALAEGWDVFETDEHGLCSVIQSDDGENKLLDDDAAIAHVNHFASQGLWFYLHALAIHHAR